MEELDHDHDHMAHSPGWSRGSGLGGGIVRKVSSGLDQAFEFRGASPVWSPPVMAHPEATFFAFSPIQTERQRRQGIDRIRSMASGDLGMVSTPLTTVLEGEEAKRQELVGRQTGVEAPEGRPVTAVEAAFSITNTVIGAGILSLPYAFAVSGFISAPICLVLTFVYFYTATLIGKAMELAQPIAKLHKIPKMAQDWPFLGMAAFGDMGQRLVSIFLSGELYAILVSYLVVVGSNLVVLFPSISKSEAIIGATALVFFLMLVPHWLLAYVSLIANLSTIICVLAFIYTGLYLPHTAPSSDWVFVAPLGLPIMIGIVNFCFVAHSVFPTIYQSMGKPSQYKWSALASFIVALVTYAGTGAFGYLVFGAACQEQFTQNLGVDLEGRPIPGLAYLPMISTLCMCIKLEGSFPMFAAPLIIALENVMGLSPDMPAFDASSPKYIASPTLLSPSPRIVSPALRRMASMQQRDVKGRGIYRFLLRVGFLAVTGIVSLVFQSSAAGIQGLTGSLFSPCTCVIFPALFFWRIAHQQGVKLPWWQQAFLALLLLFGFSCQIFGTTFCVLSMLGVVKGAAF